MLSPTLTFQMKTKAWLAVREQLVGAGYPHRTKGQLKKKWEDSATSTKAKYAKKRKTGGGAIEWTTLDELVTDILGKDNPSLTSIPGGIDSGDNRFDRPATTIDNSNVDDCERQSTSSCALMTSNEPALSNINPPSTYIEVTELSSAKADEVDAHSDTDSVNIHTHQPAKSEPSTDRKMCVEAVYAQHLTEEHEIKMRIMRKKEELVDLKLRYYGQKIARECEK